MWPVFEVALPVQTKSVFQNWALRSCSLISYCTIFSWLCILSEGIHINVYEDVEKGGLGFINMIKGLIFKEI